MSKSRVPISWVSRMILNKSLPVQPSHHHPISIPSAPSLFRHNPCIQTRQFSVLPEDSKQAIFQLLEEAKRETQLESQPNLRARIVVDEEKEQKQDYMGLSSVIEKLEKQIANDKGFVETDFVPNNPANYDLLSSWNYNGVLGLAKGPALPFSFQKPYEKCFQNRMIHNLVGGVKPLENLNAKDKAVGKSESFSSISESTVQPHPNALRPLSPHLPVYKPQSNAILSILNRVSGIFLTVVVSSFYLLYLKTGLICFTYENFYQFLFYSSKLGLITTELTALALAYHVYAGVRHLSADFSGKVGK